MQESFVSRCDLFECCAVICLQHIQTDIHSKRGKHLFKPIGKIHKMLRNWGYYCRRWWLYLGKIWAFLFYYLFFIFYPPPLPLSLSLSFVVYWSDIIYSPAKNWISQTESNTPIYPEHTMFLRAFPMPVVCHQQIRNTQMLFCCCFHWHEVHTLPEQTILKYACGWARFTLQCLFVSSIQNLYAIKLFQTMCFIYSLVALCVCSEFWSVFAEFHNILICHEWISGHVYNS